MKKNNHLILRQVFHLQFPPASEGFGLQKQISRIATEQIQPDLASLFDRLASPEELIRFDYLEIDVGTIPFPLLEERLVLGVHHEVERLISQQIKYSTPESTEFSKIPVDFIHFDQWTDYLKNGYYSWESSSFTEAEVLLSVLDYMVIHPRTVGQLKKLLLDHPPALLRLILQHNGSFLIRLMETVSGKPYRQIPDWMAEFCSLLEKLARLDPDFTSKEPQKIYTDLWATALKYAFSQKPEANSPGFFVLAYWEEIIENLFHKEKKKEKPLTLIHLTKRIIEENPTSLPLLSTIKSDLLKPKRWTNLDQDEAKPIIDPNQQQQKNGKADDIEKSFQETPGKQNPDNDDHPAEGQEKKDKKETKLWKNNGNPKEKDEEKKIADQKHYDTEEKKSFDKKGENSTDSDRQVKSQSENIKEEDKENKLNPDQQYKEKNREEFKNETQNHSSGKAWYVETAGIILLHPFIKAYFESLGLMTKGLFREESSHQRAVHLMHYLATGKAKAPEHEMILAKFFCGLPFETPIERDIELSQKEVEESEKLLNAVINHWEKLGNSSPNALREGFLLRSGKLEKRKENWHLTVEQKSIDVLLDFIPWNLRMVKLPWMEDLLYVEWG